MPGVDLAAVMDEIAARVAVTGLFEDRVYAWPKSAITAPAFLVGYPPQIDMDASMGRGADRMSVPCWAVCGAADDLSARDVLSGLLLEIKDALDGESDAWQTARAGAITVEVNVYPDGTELLEARFDVDVVT